ncbi:MAG: DUF4367 domain-containing protein, partial [Omnitrophica WOR_2 bacterium]
DDFLYKFRKPPRPEFTAALYQRITQPMKTTTRTRVLRAVALSFAMVAVIAIVLIFSPSARAFAQSILRQFGVGGYIFVQGTSEPTVSPEEQATLQAIGKPMIQPANDAAAASQLAGFTVLAPSYLPVGYTADNQPGGWTVIHEINGVMASITYDNQADDDHLTIQEQMVRQGEPNTVINRPDIQDVTVRGQPGAWMPTGGGKNLLAWEENGITYMIISNKLPKDEVLKVAESLGK